MLPQVKADRWDQKTIFTFSGPAEDPGKLLGAGTLGIAGRLVDGPREATAIFDFPHAGSTDASCSTSELAIGDGHGGPGHAPGRSASLTVWLLAIPGTGSYRRICRAPFGNPLGKQPSFGSPIDPHKPIRLTHRPKHGISQRIDFESTRIQSAKTAHSYHTDGFGQS